MLDCLLRIEDLRIEFPTDDGLVVAVDGLDLSIERGRVVGLVGESGCGKSVTGFSVLRLLQLPGKIARGRLLYRRETEAEEIDLAKLHPDSPEIRGIRGREVAMIFQEPMSSLTPVYTVGSQIVEAIRTHEKIPSQKARIRAIELLRSVGIPAPEQRVDEYPHQLSGGMRQRAMIAMALSCGPRLLVADEPTTALDVTISAQIMDLLKNLQEERGLSILMITHDMGIVAEIADDVVVMYAGMAVESTSAVKAFAEPQHPYTQGLLSSVPGAKVRRGERLSSIEGVVPDWRNLPKGCLFAPRCPERFDRCEHERPYMVAVAEGHNVACWARTQKEETAGVP